MKTIILNGSPKKNMKESNTLIFINEFMKDMKEKCTVKFISKENPKDLAEELKDYDNILLFTPLYVHAMPGSVMKLIGELDSNILQDKNFGFLIQAGFPESAQQKYVIAYLKELCKELKCNYLGTISKGEAAATYMMPNKFKKVFKSLNDLGRNFEKTNSFHEEICENLAYPYNLSDYSFSIRSLLRVCETLKINNIFWNMELKKNNVFSNRFDKPFL